MKLIVATNNQGKVREFSRILSPLGFEVTSLKDEGMVSNPEETGATFAENARIKAKAVFDKAHCACVADDSGLSVDALGGAPGVYTARYAGVGATDAENNAKLLKDMEDIPENERKAEFKCALCMILENGEEIAVQGECRGVIADSPRGNGGFGYDPLFLVGEHSYAELSSEQKDSISHRGNALKALVRELNLRKIQR